MYTEEGTICTVALEPDTRRTLSRAGDAQRKATDRRNEAIVAAHKVGASYREIAEAVGLSHTAVAQIIRRDR